MRCPLCNHEDTKVLDSRVTEDTVRRRRECPQCEERFTTYEKVELRRTVIKKDQSREPFQEEKIRLSVQKALHKDDRSQADTITDHVINRLLTKRSEVITSREIGRTVMQELRKVNKLAYWRYASVHKAMNDPKALEKELQAII